MSLLTSAVSLLVAVLLLSGCATKSVDSSPPSASAGRVDGTVYYIARIALPPTTTLSVKLLDVTDSTKPVVISEEKRVIGMLTPAPFALKFSPAKIKSDRVYQVRAKLDAEGNIWTHEQQYPVLTGNTPAYVEIRVSPLRSQR